MASHYRYTGTSLIDITKKHYRHFNVFQLIRLLLKRDAVDSCPVEQCLVFRAELDAGFQGNEITQLKFLTVQGKETGQIALYTRNYCLDSELGPLPSSFLEWIRDLQRSGHKAMAAFLNIFNQRIHVLRYELKQRSLRILDPAKPENTAYAKQIAALIGVALPSQQQQIPLPKHTWLGMAGLLINYRRSAEVIELVLSRFLGARVKLKMLIGRWRNIEDSNRMLLGKCNHRLGQSTLLGHRMWDRQADVRLEIEEINYREMLSILPLRRLSGKAHSPVSFHFAFVSLVHLLLDRRHDCIVQITPDSRNIPLSYLKSQDYERSLRLGQTAWLMSGKKSPQEPLCDPVRFRIRAYDPPLNETCV